MLVLAVCVVEHGVRRWIANACQTTSDHTEIICTNNHDHAMRFLREASDASMVAVNASQPFQRRRAAWPGAEIGDFTSKLHDTPHGVDELTTTKFVVLGQGQVRR